jgi:hypothetical protein
MPKAPLAALIAASLLVSPARPSWACLHGASQSHPQTGEVAGSTRSEKLVAHWDGRSSKIVKLFVAPRNARLTVYTLTAAEARRHEALASRARRTEPVEKSMRYVRAMPRPAARYKTKSGIEVAIYPEQGSSWQEIRQRYELPETTGDEHYAEWLKRIAAGDRGLFAAVIDMSKAKNKPKGGEALGLAVKVDYAAKGEALRQEVALDKWLEFLGTRRTTAILHTPWPDAQIAAALESVLAKDADILESGEGVVVALRRDLKDPGPTERTIVHAPGLKLDRPMFSILDGDVYSYNDGLRLTALKKP